MLDHMIETHRAMANDMLQLLPKDKHFVLGLPCLNERELGCGEQRVGTDLAGDRSLVMRS